MRVVIGGGSGLIGAALADALVEAGHEPVILSRHAKATSTALPTGTDANPAAIRRVAWDPPVPGDWVKELAGAGAVINLAGASIGHWPWTKKRKAELIGSRVTATRALVNAITSLPDAERPKVFLAHREPTCTRAATRHRPTKPLSRPTRS